MIYCFYTGVSLGLVILQTTLLAYLPLFASIYDLLLPFVIYLAFYRSVREGLLIVFFLGFIMDNLSGSPFGLYLTTYCWLFIGVKWTIKYVQVANRVLLSLVVAAGVLLENSVFMGASAIMEPDLVMGANEIRSITFQIFWALGTGPLFLTLLRHAQHRFDNLMKTIVARRSHLF